MCISRVQWTIIPLHPPQPAIACGGCGWRAYFRSSNKVRLNANGKRLDAWLIYKCRICNSTWNRPIFKRRRVRDIDPAVLDALQTNDPDWIRPIAFDLADLRRRTPCIQLLARSDVKKVVLSGETESVLEIALSVPGPAYIRLDRLLASELGLSRSRIKALQRKARLRLDPGGRDALRWPPKDGTRVTIDLAGLEDGEAIMARACGRIPA